MAIVKYNEEWNKFFERMGQQDLPLLKKIGTKALLFDMKKRYRGVQTVMIVSHLTKIVDAENKPQEGYDQLRISERDGLKAATFYFAPMDKSQPMQKLYAIGMKGEVGAVIDYTDKGASYTFRYSDKGGFSKVERYVDREGGRERPSEIVEDKSKKKDRPKTTWFRA